MTEEFEAYVANRCDQLGLSQKDLCTRAGVSRQTLHSMVRIGDHLPSLQTAISVAHALQVSPVGLLQLLCDRAERLRSRRGRGAHRRYTGDASAFVSDVDVPDGTLVLPGQTFIKTWELQNVGSMAWTDRTLKCMDEHVVVQTKAGEDLHIAQRLQPDTPWVPVPQTPPGATVRVSVRFTAPDAPGSVLSYWKLAHGDGTLCFPQARGVWVKVQVTTLHAAESASSPIATGGASWRQS